MKHEKQSRDSTRTGTHAAGRHAVDCSTSEWIREPLPNHCHHIGLAPVLNLAYLDEPASGIEAARADLYEKGLVAITGDGQAIKLAADFVALLGAVPLFAGLDELDGFLAAVHTLPKLTAAALTNALIQAPGWTDRRKLAGNIFAASTALAADGGAALYEEALANRENILHVLDNLIAELAVFRYQLDEKNVALKSHFESAVHSREQWLKQRRSGNWLAAEMRTPDMPRFRDHLKQIVGDPAKLFGLRRKTTKDE